MATPLKISKRILVIDDEPLVAQAVRMVLAFAGYEVLVAGGSQEGLALLEQREIDLVITDFNMPDMRGDELALHIKARWPDKPVIMLTAFAENIRNSSTVVACVDVLISKPFEVADLRLAVAQTLASRNPPQPPERP